MSIAEAAAVAPVGNGSFDLGEYDHGFEAEGVFCIEVAVIVGG